jgi:hypothetical protein
MIEVEDIHGYNISHRGDVPNGLKYLREYWDSQEVKDIFRDCRDAKRAGHQFHVHGYGYILFHDGDYKYFLKADK